LYNSSTFKHDGSCFIEIIKFLQILEIVKLL